MRSASTMLQHRQPTIVAKSATNVAPQVAVQALSRRDLALFTASTFLMSQQVGQVQAAEELVPYVPTKDKTPALRAGVINPEERWSFSIPTGVKEARLSNTVTGNFCMPKCAEPWIEVAFEDPKLGRVQLTALPLLKLTNSKNAAITDLGSPEALLPRIAPYITGTYYDEDWVEDVATKKQDDGLPYYIYQMNSLDALQGPHSLTAVTAKGEVVYMFILTANEKQWKTSQPVLRQVLDTFRA